MTESFYRGENYPTPHSVCRPTEKFLQNSEYVRNGCRGPVYDQTPPGTQPDVSNRHLQPEFNVNLPKVLVDAHHQHTIICPHVIHPHFVTMADQSKAKYQVVSMRERHGPFRKAVPIMPLPLSFILCFINMIAPGVGTLIAGLTVICGCKTEHKSKGTSLAYNILAAILQLVLAPVVVGWVWSIMWGVTFVNLSCSVEDDMMDEATAAAVAAQV